MFKIFKNKKKEDVKENLYHVTPISSNLYPGMTTNGVIQTKFWI